MGLACAPDAALTRERRRLIVTFGPAVSSRSTYAPRATRERPSAGPHSALRSEARRRRGPRVRLQAPAPRRRRRSPRACCGRARGASQAVPGRPRSEPVGFPDRRSGRSGRARVAYWRMRIPPEPGPRAARPVKAGDARAVAAPPGAAAAWTGDCRDKLRAAAIDNRDDVTGTEPAPHRRRIRQREALLARGIVRVDRATKWGNAFRIGRDGTRAEVVERYRATTCGGGMPAPVRGATSRSSRRSTEETSLAGVPTWSATPTCSPAPPPAPRGGPLGRHRDDGPKRCGHGDAPRLPQRRWAQ